MLIKAVITNLGYSLPAWIPWNAKAFTTTSTT